MTWRPPAPGAPWPAPPDRCAGRTRRWRPEAGRRPPATAPGRCRRRTDTDSRSPMAPSVSSAMRSRSSTSGAPAATSPADRNASQPISRSSACTASSAAARAAPRAAWVPAETKLVAVEGAAGRRGVVARGPQREIAGVLVERAELDAVGVRRFQMPRDHLVGVERHAGSARGHPVGQSLMKIRAVRLQQPAVGDVADQHVVEAPDRLVTDIGPARLGRARADEVA